MSVVGIWMVALEGKVRVRQMTCNGGVDVDETVDSDHIFAIAFRSAVGCEFVYPLAKSVKDTPSAPALDTPAEISFATSGKTDLHVGRRMLQHDIVVVRD